MRLLVTGNAGFIGFHVARRLLQRGDTVIGFDSIDDYYDVALKKARLRELEVCAKLSPERYAFMHADLVDAEAVERCFARHRPERVIHLAAQAGVRYSLENPQAYVASNLVGFTNIIEACRRYEVGHFVYASTSSVYGGNASLPFSESHMADHPLQFYAATKRSNELMAHAYSHLYALPATGLRFFTVYGPWGRPDMAPFVFTRNIIEGKRITLFNRGEHSRDFTYIDDVVETVLAVVDNPARPDPDWSALRPDPATSAAPFKVYNVGNGKPVRLGRFVREIEKCVGRKADISLLPLQPGDVRDTAADTKRLRRDFGFRPATPLAAGIAEFVRWYREFYGIDGANDETD